MLLTEFINTIWQEGKVTVANELVPFSAEDLHTAMERLQQYYSSDVLENSGNPPAFDATAALWGASYLYRAVQLALLREHGADTVNDLLTPYDGEIIPETIYSVDLCFRYLPDLLALAKGLAPEDVLVKCLQQATIQWPLSSVGMTIETEPDLQVILSNDCLRQLYIDRIIGTRDTKRSKNESVNEYIREALGDHATTLWPGFQPLIKAK